MKNVAKLTAILKTKNSNKFQVEIQQIVDNPTARPNLAAMANKGDERFKANEKKPRYAFQGFEAAVILAAWDIDCSTLKFDADGRHELATPIVDPKLEGHSLNVEIQESMTQQYEGQKPKQFVDGAGSLRYFIKDGSVYYSRTVMCAGEPKHSIITADLTVLASEVSVAKKSGVSVE